MSTCHIGYHTLWHKCKRLYRFCLVDWLFHSSCHIRFLHPWLFDEISLLTAVYSQLNYFCVWNNSCCFLSTRNSWKEQVRSFFVFLSSCTNSKGYTRLFAQLLYKLEALLQLLIMQPLLCAIELRETIYRQSQ